MGRPPLPAAATIEQLRTPDRQTAIANRDEIAEFQAKGLNDCFRGRHRELTRLGQAFHGASGPRAENRRGARPYGALLYGAPGSGKSALKDYWREHGPQQGHAVIRVPPRAFTSREELRDALIRSDEWQAAMALRKLGSTVGDILGRISEPTGEALSALVRNEAGIEIDPSMYPMLGGLLQLAEDEPATETDCLNRLSASFRNGWTISVDEAEDIDVLLGTPLGGTLLQTIGDPSMRNDAHRLGGLLLAGLSDTVLTLNELKLTRFHQIRMQRLEAVHAVGIIRHAIDHAELSPPARSVIRDRWTRTLARDFYIWPHHTRCAALAAQFMAEEVERKWQQTKTEDSMEYDEELEAARTMAANGAAMLYNARWNYVAQYADEVVGRETVALAMATDNIMHRSQLQHLIDLQPRLAGESRREQWIKHLVHSGLIEPLIPDLGHPDDRGLEIGSRHFRIPVPSMANYVANHNAFQPDASRVAQARDHIRPEMEAASTALRNEQRKHDAMEAQNTPDWANHEWPEDGEIDPIQLARVETEEDAPQ